MENAKEKKLHIVRKWFGFITEHSGEEIFSSLVLIMEGGDITRDMKEFGIPADVFKPITTWIDNPEYRHKIVTVLKPLAHALTETDDRAAVIAAYMYLLFVDKKREWGNDLIPILEWYEALYEWDIPTMEELDREKD